MPQPSSRTSSRICVGVLVVVNLLSVALPLLVLGRLRTERAVWPFVAASGVLEVVGYLSFAWAAREDIAVAAVIASQSAVLTVLAGHRLAKPEYLDLWHRLPADAAVPDLARKPLEAITVWK